MNLVISAIVGGLSLFFVSLLLMTAENWHQMRGHTWRLTSVWMFVGLWICLGTVANLIGVFVEGDSGADIFTGTDVPDWLEGLALTVFTSLVLLFTGGGFVARRLFPNRIAAVSAWLTFFPLGYVMTSFLFWMATGKNASDQTVFNEIASPVGWLGIYAIVLGVYGLTIAVFRLIMEAQTITLGTGARRWLLGNTTARSLLDECRHIQMARHPVEDVFTKAVTLAENALKATPSMPTRELDAVLEALSPAEAIDAKCSIQRNLREHRPQST